MKIPATLVILVVSLAACGRSGTDPELYSDSSVPTHAFRDYAFDFQRECFCAPEARTPVRITVRNRVVTEVRSRTSGAPLTDLASWPSIEEIYRQVDAAVAAGEAVSFEYDANGDPAVIRIGSLAADAGVVYHLGRLTRL